MAHRTFKVLDSDIHIIEPPDLWPRYIDPAFRDRAVRAFCTERKIVYQGFSLLTANPEVLRHPLVADIAARRKATPAQVVFRFAQVIGMLPLTGTSDAEHMKQDLASRDLSLSADEVQAIESLAG